MGMGEEMQSSEAGTNTLTHVNMNRGGFSALEVSSLSLVDQVSH